MDVLVVGAGIGGLAAAVAARLSGHRAVVLERSSRIGEVGAGVGMAPNATAALRALGAHDLLARSAVVVPRWQRRRWDDGSVVGEIPLGDTAIRHFGSPFWTIHRGDLHQALYELAVGSGPGEPVDVRLATGATAIDTEGNVHTTAGTVTGDLVIGADGVRSKLRAALFDPTEAIYSGNAAYRVQLRADQLRADPIVAHLADNRTLQTWMGPGLHLLIMAIRGGDMLNCTICVTAEQMSGDDWSGPATKAELREYVADWHPSLPRLVDLAPSTHRWDLYDREPLPTLVNGKVALLGDAAHPMLPYLGQGAAQALEDAVSVMSLLRDAQPADVPSLLTRYDEARLRHTAAVQSGSRANRDIYHLPDGPEQQERDARLRNDSADLTTFDWLWQIQHATAA